MSFSGNAKAEMSKGRAANILHASSELYGGLLYSGRFDKSGVRIVTESRHVAERMRTLLKKVFGFDFDSFEVRPGRNPKEVLSLADKNKLWQVFERYGHEMENSLSLHLNAAVLEDEECPAAFLRGAFLVGGSVSNPESGYHLELVTRHYHLSREIFSLLLDMDFEPKATVRKSNYVTYFKDSEAIEDFLTKCGAPASALQLMEMKVEKDLRNRVNRRVNCETANLGKAVDAAGAQIRAIKRLEDSGALYRLPEKLQAAAKLRLSHPDASLAELAGLSPELISRSGLNHRLSKLISLAEETDMSREG